MHQIGSYIPAQQEMTELQRPSFVPNLEDSDSGKGITQTSQASCTCSLQEALKNAAVLQDILVFSIIYATYCQGHRCNTSSTNVINQLLTFPVHGFLHRYSWLFSNFTQTSALPIQRCKFLITQKQSNGYISIKQRLYSRKSLYSRKNILS